MNESVEQIDPTAEISSETVKKRVVKGAAILTLRTIFMQIVSFIAVGLLTVFLEPAEYGVFFLVSAVINFLAYFGDIGFAAALIQKKEKLGNNELKTIFTIQQILALVLILLVFIFTPIIKNIYSLSQEAIFLLWALAFSLLLSSLKTIPSVILERKLEFNKLIIPQIIETVIFNTTAVYLSYKGFGVTSFTIAILLRGFFGLTVTYFVQPWLPGIYLARDSIRGLLRFGLPYQLNIFLAMIKDDGMTLLLGNLLGPSGIGLLAWAQKWAYAPLRFFMDQAIKVTFPAFSRLQNEKEELSSIVTKSIFFVSLLVFPSIVMLLLLAPTLVSIIPRYGKWEPALFALSILTINSALAAVTTPLTNTLNAIGKISVTFKLMVMWTVLTWVFVPTFAYLYGLNGAAIGFTLVGLSSFVALYLISKYVNINYYEAVSKPIVASLIMAVAVFLAKNFFYPSLTQVFTMVIVSFLSYSLAILIMEPTLFSLINKSIKSGIKRK